MNRSIKLLLLAALMLGSTAAFAQKFGRIDYASVIQAMPEMTTVQEQMNQAQTEAREHLETLQVEVNRKVDEFSKLPETTTASVRQMKEREIIDLQQRQQEYLQIAQQGLDQTQQELMTPIIEKLDAAIRTVAKAQSIMVVFQMETSTDVIYVDDSAVDITAAVKSELGIAS